jgi:dUTP pyrophosphatase
VQRIATNKLNVTVKILNQSDNELPKYAKEGDSGMDIRANEKVTIFPKDSKLIKTGIFVELPEDYEIQIRPRSGLALKKGITVLNTPGTIDQGYRNEIGVILYNSSDDNFCVEKGMRIAQMVLQMVPKIKWEVVNDINKNTDRGTTGFGASGV